MSSEEASIFSTFLFCLLMFVISTSEIEARKLEVEKCSSSCGDGKNISYPLHLKGDPAGCGHPELELSCESNKTILESNSGKYYVKRISYDKSTISVVDANLAYGSCSFPSTSFSPPGRDIPTCLSPRGMKVFGPQRDNPYGGTSRQNFDLGRSNRPVLSSDRQQRILFPLNFSYD
ncbi:hypothetical protein CUMW_158170 [Citrus unshiu]|uniref:Wall-associated receptor kinase galacturonan-binding domain-containing protein n=1 Tax=Citrus unshiu TaxID=55188 RepID=A0A2H5PQI6_CITUN|nr:hypothetical protein CUMW_158170 [Citrus unshiu]